MVYFQRMDRRSFIETCTAGAACVSAAAALPAFAGDAKPRPYAPVLLVTPLGDPIKASAADTIRELHDLGLKVIMMTGDNERTARAASRVR